MAYLFDIEPSDKNKELSFAIAGVEFMVYPQAGASKHINPFMSFYVNDSSIIDELHQKIQFYSYKEQADNLIEEKSSTNLLFRDPDGRLWEILSKS